MNKNLKKSQAEFRIEKVIKRKGDQNICQMESL